jgi:mono/diheme cytochrome c family protein
MGRVVRAARGASSTLFALCMGAACSSNDDARVPGASDGGGGRDAAASSDATTTGSRQPAFCEREGADAIRDVFCVDPQPVIRSLTDLQFLIGHKLAISDEPPPVDPSVQDDLAYQAAAVAVLGHSTALSGHLVSPINPRVLATSTDVFTAFQRGAQRIELIARTRDAASLNFYLLSFTQACNERSEGCSPGDLYTPRIESDWIEVQIQDGEELKNAPQDCRICHDRKGEGPRLLMRELESPWTHFMLPPGFDSPTPVPNGSDLMGEYVNAKDRETYAGFSMHDISTVSPFMLEVLVGNAQPLLFDAPTIEDERYPYGPDGYPEEPGPSPTWEAGYEAFKRGEQLALPYVDMRVTDPAKQAALTKAYQRFATGEMRADELPDLSDIFPDDPLERARRGLQTEPGATPEDALIQACASCHNDVLDQSISRARFNVSVSRLDRRELDYAIERIRLPSTAAGAMPPAEARQLDPAVRDALIEYLEQDPSALDPDGRLDRAAKLGMTGGGATSGSGFF